MERAFGHRKGRFGRLQEIPLHSIKDTCQLIYAACILHNLCILHDEDVEEYITVDDDLDLTNCQYIFQNGHNGIVRHQWIVNVP